MNQRLRDLYGHVSVHATADREHQAVIELLLLVMMADRHITDDELDEIRAISDDSGWESATFSFDQYLGEAMAKVRSAVAAHDTDTLLDDIDDRIVSSVLRQSLFSRRTRRGRRRSRHRPRGRITPRSGRCPLRLNEVGGVGPPQRDRGRSDQG